MAYGILMFSKMDDLPDQEEDSHPQEELGTFCQLVLTWL